MLQGSQGSRDRSRSLIRAELEVINVVVAKNFNHVDEYIQLQTLEVRRVCWSNNRIHSLLTSGS